VDLASVSRAPSKTDLRVEKRRHTHWLLDLGL
jgi:hypothetical protein